jgi:hypothetical protein
MLIGTSKKFHRKASMAHTVTNFQRGYYLSKCSDCASQWRVRGQYVKLVRDKKLKKYSSTTTERCPACNKEELLHSDYPWWRLLQRKNPIYRPYHTEIRCVHGTISSVRFNSIKDIRADGAGVPHLIVAHSDEPISVRGDFTTAKNLVLILNEDCVAHEKGYSIKPFDIVVNSSKIILYKLSTVLCNEKTPLISVSTENNYGVLSSNVTFSAYLTYTDPIMAKR